MLKNHVYQRSSQPGAIIWYQSPNILEATLDISGKQKENELTQMQEELRKRVSCITKFVMNNTQDDDTSYLLVVSYGSHFKGGSSVLLFRKEDDFQSAGVVSPIRGYRPFASLEVDNLSSWPIDAVLEKIYEDFDLLITKIDMIEGEIRIKFQA